MNGFGRRCLPFADVASAELPFGRLLRLSLFQVSVGVATVLLNGTVNRVMVVEFGLPASLVAMLVGLPLVFAPLRALIGFRSDQYRSAIGWRRTPYVWIGTLLQFGGLALMPFALLVLGSGKAALATPGRLALGLAFLMAGAGMHVVQTAGLALATDLAAANKRPQVVALFYVMLLIGTVLSATLFGALLQDFTATRLIRVIHGAALATLLLNTIGIWQQEARTAHAPGSSEPVLRLRDAWRALDHRRQPVRLLIVVALGTAAFGMQDILIEPYGGEVFGLTVSGTTLLTAVMALGTLAGFALAAYGLGRGGDPHGLAALGLLVGIPAFSAVVFAGPLGSTGLFEAGTAAIGFGVGLFAVGTLTAAMALGGDIRNGLALGAWGAVHATAAGLAVALGGLIRDVVGHCAAAGTFGPALNGPGAGYTVVYHIEVGLLFATLVAVGPLVRFAPIEAARSRAGFDLARLSG